MSQDQWLVLALKIVLVAGETGAILFAAVYTFLAPWIRDSVGRSVVIVDGLVGAALLVPLLSLFFTFNRLTSYVAAWFDIAVFGMVAIGLLHRAALWPKLHYGDGNLPYRKAIREFAADVIRRRGRPVWKDEEPGAPGPEEALRARVPPQSPGHSPSHRVASG